MNFQSFLTQQFTQIARRFQSRDEESVFLALKTFGRKGDKSLRQDVPIESTKEKLFFTLNLVHAGKHKSSAQTPFFCFSS
jgi:hypothetical protein